MSGKLDKPTPTKFDKKIEKLDMNKIREIAAQSITSRETLINLRPLTQGTAVTLFQRETATAHIEKRHVERKLTGFVLGEKEMKKQMSPQQRDYNQSETGRLPSPVIVGFSPTPVVRAPLVVRGETAQPPSDNLTDSTISEQPLTTPSLQNVRRDA